MLQKWPKEHWASVLQTQLRGKGLKVFAELSIEHCRQYEVFKQALLAAYELCAEVYRKRFRAVSKNTSETYADMAFKLQNAFKRWMQSIDAYDDINLMRQACMMEQLSEVLPSDLKLWIVDQKCKTIDDMARAADQYVAVRKSFLPNADSQGSSNAGSQNTSAVSVVGFNNSKNYRSYDTSQNDKFTRSNYHKTDTASNARSKENNNNFLPGNQIGAKKLKPPFKCFYCSKPNHAASECRKRIADEEKGIKNGKTSQTSLLVDQSTNVGADKLL